MHPEPWTTFDPCEDPQLFEMLEAAQTFALDLVTPLAPPRWLSLLGSSGAGKTMLAREVYRAATAFERRYPYLEGNQRLRWVCWRSWPKLLGQLRDGEFRAFTDLFNSWFVAIDDIGAEHQARDGGFATSKLYELLNARLGKWTVLTSNLDLDAIEKRLDTRIASRLIRDGSTVVTMNVPDFNRRGMATN